MPDEHKCEWPYDTDERGKPIVPLVATCGTCGESWCDRCDPTPSALCHHCHGRGYSNAPIDDFDAVAASLSKEGAQ